jgi:hypothetical protein
MNTNIPRKINLLATALVYVRIFSCHHPADSHLIEDHWFRGHWCVLKKVISVKDKQQFVILQFTQWLSGYLTHFSLSLFSLCKAGFA